MLAGSSGPNATGTIDFTVFGPNNTTCTLPGTAAGSAVVHGDGTYPSSAVPVVLAGTYRWIASYTGDANNNSFTTACNAANEASEVIKASPTVTTSATPQAAAGGTISDQAIDRKSGVEGKRVDLGGRRIIKKKQTRPGPGESESSARVRGDRRT